MAEKAKYIKMTSPAGVAVFPYVNYGSPSKKYKKEDEFEYKITLALTPGDPGVDEFVVKMNEMAQEAFDEAKSEISAELKAAKAATEKKKLKKNLDRLELSEPFSPELDDEKEETGRLLISFKQNSSFTTKKGEIIDKIITLFDSTGAVIPKNAQQAVWAGSICKVGFDVGPFYMAATDLAGISKKLAAVQIISLVTKGEVSAESYGFGDEGESYVAPDEVNVGVDSASGGAYSESSADAADNIPDF
jgi:hypothetical protein